MASPAKDIKGSLILTPEQADFMENLLKLMPIACKHVSETGMMLKPGPGNMYRDFVITVKCSQDRRTCEVYRNRTGTLVFAMKDGKVLAADYEITFIVEHVKKKLHSLEEK